MSNNTSEKGIETVTLQIGGMNCSCEGSLIEKKMDSLVGIKSYDINAISKQIRISYDPSYVTILDIIRSVSETGMNASLVKDHKPRNTWWKEKQQLALYSCGIIILIAFTLRYLGVPESIANSLFALAVVVGVYYPARKALIALFNLTPTIHLLMLIGSGGAMVLGMWSEAAILIFVYSLGDVLESYAVDKARGAIRSLVELMPKEALVLKDGKEVTLSTEDIGTGDIVVVRPGERIPVDGEVVKGFSFVDQAAITGESIPVQKKLGDDVFAGTINQNGSLEVKVGKPASETILSKIICSVEEAQAKRTSYQRFSDNFAKYYTPAMFILGVLVATVPTLFFGTEWRPFIYRGLVVFVVSCSCGLALSVPVAVVAAMANAAHNGTVFKGGAYLEVVHKVKAIAFDKTGTLTIGRPEVTDVHLFNGILEKDLLNLAGKIESRSGHPIAAAIVRKAKESNAFSNLPVEDFNETSGLGVMARMNREKYIVSNIRFQEENGIFIEPARESIASLENEGKTIVLVSRESLLIGLLAIADEVRPGAKEALNKLKSAGIRTIMLTGDNERSAKAIAHQVGVDEYYAQLLPTDKVDVVKKLKEKYGSVAMVGDGINDAPAMAVSNVGIAMGAAGTDIAIEAGDVVLMSDDLSKIGYLRELSSKTVTSIKQNITVSLINIAFMVVAALIGMLGLVTGLLLNEASAILVIANALRLLKWESKAETETMKVGEGSIISPIRNENKLKFEMETIACKTEGMDCCSGEQETGNKVLLPVIDKIGKNKLEIVNSGTGGQSCCCEEKPIENRILLPITDKKGVKKLETAIRRSEGQSCCCEEKTVNDRICPPTIEKERGEGLVNTVSSTEEVCCCCEEKAIISEVPVTMLNESKGQGLKAMTFKIEGMSCSCEGQIIEKKMRLLQGVKTFSLNPITNQIRVTFDPLTVSIVDIEKVVSKAGMKAVLIKSK